jgi:hypothetical protein
MPGGKIHAVDTATSGSNPKKFIVLVFQADNFIIGQTVRVVLVIFVCNKLIPVIPVQPVFSPYPNEAFMILQHTIY